MFVRVEVARRPEFNDPEADRILRRIEMAHPKIRRAIRWARMLQVYWLEVQAPREQVIPAVSAIFHDPVVNWLFTGDLIPSTAGSHGGLLDLFESAPQRSGNFWGIERRFRPGVTDNVGRSAREALDIVLAGKNTHPRASSGCLLVLEGVDLKESDVTLLAKDVLSNELIHSWTLVPAVELRSNERFQPDHVRFGFSRSPMKGSDRVHEVALDGLNDQALTDMSREALWALSLDEMKAIRKHFQDNRVKSLRTDRDLPIQPTDVEMEVFAQTWSEHCKHKIFNATIHYREIGESPWGVRSSLPERVDSLFKTTIAGTTAEIQRPWLLSVFKDNAGIVALDEEDAICIKVETHNSPSALDPYGGALTGIVGVNRDILGCGRGAKPIFNTDVFCVAKPDYLAPLPDRILHPRRILDGVRKGVEDGGNQSGIPTVNGALVFDDRFLGKPLIYCGTGGIMPRMSGGIPCQTKEIRPSDRVFMVGGRIGKDGIHGATFSSLALQESSPTSAVQLGDPITQKRMSDFILEARDLGLYRTLTDNGAGGLSSSVGELATLSGGAKIDVGLAKTKYPGLRPYELVISESQERMTVAVPPEKRDAFKVLAQRRGVEVSDLGEFNTSGFFEILYNGKALALIDLKFLHHGGPTLEIEASWTHENQTPGKIEWDFSIDGPKRLLELLERPNIASKEWLIRQYDHEVQGMSVIKPLHTRMVGTPSEFSGPNDAAVLKPKPNKNIGIAVGCGINPKLSDLDPYLMAQSAVDESVRNILAVGAEYGTAESMLALVDNFCWPDPLVDTEKAGALVRACFGLRDACLELGAPLISGKDSMKNDYVGKREGKEIRISVPPTLLVTAMGRVKDIRKARTADFKGDGQSIYLLGGRQFGLLGSEMHAMLMERIREKGGSQNSAVLPTSNLLTKEHRLGLPDWRVAQRIYRWLGGSLGEHQERLSSVHDVSEGGVLVAVVESILGRGLGGLIQVPRYEDPWEFCFGEGFHSFVVSCSPAHTQFLEAEWKNYEVPFLAMGHVQKAPRLEVQFQTGVKPESWSLDMDLCRKAWSREGYWE